MPFHFYSSHSTPDNVPLANACIFSEEIEQRAEWRDLNPQAVNLCPNDTLSTSIPPLLTFTTRTDTGPISDNVISECRRVRDRIHKISPSNPAIVFTNSPDLSDGALSTTANVFCSALTITSTSRTVELYSSGEYIGTFRGDPLILSTPPLNPLFTVHIDNQSLPRRCQELLVKFFIPAKPPVKPPLIPGAITLHWLALQGKVPTIDARPLAIPETTGISSLTTSGSTIKDISTIDPVQSLLSGVQGMPSTLSASSFSLPMFAGLHSPGSDTINLEMVRSMLDQMEVGQLSQGAMTLMQAMEAQAVIISDDDVEKSGSNFSSESRQDISLYCTPCIPVPKDQISPTSPQLEKSGSESSSLQAESSESTYVTRVELEQMETRIMGAIDQRFKEMEEKILNKLLGTKKNFVE